MEKRVYITEEEWEKCRKVIDAFAELYETADEDVLFVSDMLKIKIIFLTLLIRHISDIIVVT